MGFCTGLLLVHCLLGAPPCRRRHRFFLVIGYLLERRLAGVANYWSCYGSCESKILDFYLFVIGSLLERRLAGVAIVFGCMLLCACLFDPVNQK